MIFSRLGTPDSRWRRVVRTLLYILVSAVVALACWLIIVDLCIENDDPYTAAPHNTQWVTVGASNIAYQHTPAESPKNVVLIGGTTAWSGVWQYTTEDLGGIYNVYAIDLPPFGYSRTDESHTYTLGNQADLINGFIEALDLHGATLVAHSYGAGPAMEAVLRKPDNYASFVIIDGAIHVDREQNGAPALVRHIFNIATLRYALTSLAVHSPGFMRASLKYLVHDNRSVNKFWVDIYKRPLSVEDQSRRLGRWLYDFVFRGGTGLSSESENYKTLRTPVTILWGREDNLTPLAQGEYLHAIIPHSEFVALNDIGHIPMIDDHERYIEVLKAHLVR